MRIGPFELRNQDPLGCFLVVEVAAINGGVVGLRLDSDPEPLGDSGGPRVEQVALAARPFSLEDIDHHSRSRLDQLHKVVGGELVLVISLLRTPHREENPPFSRRVYLHAKVTFSEADRHGVGADRVIPLRDCHFVVKPLQLLGRLLVPEVHRRTSSTEVRGKAPVHVVDCRRRGSSHEKTVQLRVVPWLCVYSVRSPLYVHSYVHLRRNVYRCTHLHRLY